MKFESTVSVFLFLLQGFNAGGKLVVLNDCGLSNVTGSGDRIVGGIEALPGQFPWQVSLRYSTFFSKPTHLCGATILNQWWILTAAHCVARMWKWNLNVATGLFNQNEKVVTSYAVSNIIMHNQFDPRTYLNDIALIKVKKPLFLTKRVNGICLPMSSEKTTGIVTATGWGRTQEDIYESSILRYVNLPVVPDDICKSIFGEDYSEKAMLCAGYPEGGKDTCQGDSGGPLIRQQNNRAVLVGIVSSGVGCGRPMLPGVYTRVSNYIDWIQANI